MIVGYRIGNNPNRQIRIASNDLQFSLAILGMPRSGKTNTAFLLLEQFVKEQPDIPILAIDPIKTDYRRLWNRIARGIALTELKVMPGFNPFLATDPQSSISLLRHGMSVAVAFSLLFPGTLLAKQYVEDMVSGAIEGWFNWLKDNYTEETKGYTYKTFPFQQQVKLSQRDGLEHPWFSMDHFLKYAKTYVSSLETVPGSKLGADKKSFMNDFLGRLKQSEIVLLFLSQTTKTVKPYFTHNVYLELYNVFSSEEERITFAGLLLLLRSEYLLQSQGGKDCALKHVLVLEEAHRLVRQIPPGIVESPTPAMILSQHIRDGILTLQGAGGGTVLVSQTPMQLSSEALESVSTKIVHRVEGEGNCSFVAQALGLRPEQEDTLSVLKVPGAVSEAFVKLREGGTIRCEVPLSETKKKATTL